MKKFNIDELIWFVILMFLTMSIVFLIKSGELTNFVGSDMLIYFYISIIILVIFMVFQFSRIFTVRRKIEITNRFIPITFTLVVGVILLLALPVLEKDNNLNNDLILYENTDAILITNDNYGVLEKIIDNKNIYEGRDIIFLGFVDNQNNYDETIISREFISCCQADKEKIQIRVKGIDSTVSEGQWISVVGKICFDDTLYIESKEYKVVNKPKDIYFHEPL